MPTRIQLRRDTEANWTAQNPTLSSGEPGFVRDTGELVVGDGSTPFTGLPRFPVDAATKAELDAFETEVRAGGIDAYATPEDVAAEATARESADLALADMIDEAEQNALTLHWMGA